MEKIFTTNEAIKIYDALNNFIKKDIDLPIQMAWNIEDNVEALKKVADRFNKYQQELLQPLQEQDGIKYENDLILPVEGFEEEYQKVVDKVNEARAVKNTVNIKMITRDDLPGRFSVKDLETLKFMMEEEISIVD